MLALSTHPRAPRPPPQLESNAAHYRRLKAAFDAHTELPEPPPAVVDLRFDTDEDETAQDSGDHADDEGERGSVRDRMAARGGGSALSMLRSGSAASRKAAAFSAAVAGARERDAPPPSASATATAAAAPAPEGVANTPNATAAATSPAGPGLASK